MSILLNYIFPVSTIEPTAQASTSFLKQVCLVVSPNGGGTSGDITECVTMAEVAEVTDNLEAQQLFNAGMAKVFILQADDLDLADALEGHEADFFTLLISSDFTKEEITHVDTVAAVKASIKIQDITYTAKTAGTGGNSTTINYDTGGTAGAESVGVVGSAITVTMETGVSTADNIRDAVEAEAAAAALVDVSVDSGDETDTQVSFGAAVSLAGGIAAVAGTEDGLQLGEFDGVVGVSDVDDSFLEDQAAQTNRCAFHTTTTNKAKNMCYAFGKMLSNALNWRNQQYIEMPFADDVDTDGEAESLFDERISFVLSGDAQYAERLSLFAAGGEAIVAPYIKKNLQIDMQSSALSYISGNQPAYTKKNAALLEDELQKVIQDYIDDQWLEAGTVSVETGNDTFVVNCEINIAPPSALWRVFGEMSQTL